MRAQSDEIERLAQDMRVRHRRIMIGLLGGTLLTVGLGVFGVTHPGFIARYLDVIEIGVGAPGFLLLAWSVLDLGRRPQ